MNSESLHVLQPLSLNSHLQAKFINSLSLLEYIGARKIIKSQDESRLTRKLLAHIAEEIRHAQMLKHLALRMSDQQLTSYSDEHTLCKQQAVAYIQGIDQAVAQRLGSPNAWLNYLVTTLLIEERANELYSWYALNLADDSHKRIFNGIVKEENQHLSEVLVQLEQQPGISDIELQSLRDHETRLFCDLTTAVQTVLDGPAASSSVAADVA